jgi:hypothetical protein
VTVNAADQFRTTALTLSAYRRKTIAELTRDQPLLRQAALQLRKVVRGSKLPRRLRRKAQLGLCGSF